MKAHQWVEGAVSPAALGVHPVPALIHLAPGSTAQVCLLPDRVIEADKDVASVHILVCNAPSVHVLQPRSQLIEAHCHLFDTQPASVMVMISHSDVRSRHRGDAAGHSACTYDSPDDATISITSTHDLSTLGL